MSNSYKIIDLKTDATKLIEKVYEDLLFKDNFANRMTGVLRDDEFRKVATYPYIGSNYGTVKKVLIVGLDIGKDECKGEICSMEYRNQIEKYDLKKLNPHISGTYFTSLYFLKDDLCLNDFWEDTKTSKYGKNFATILRKAPSLPEINPLSYIAMTNFYKYVTKGRTSSRRGSFDRVFIDREREIKLFLCEIDALKPDVIFFQSIVFKNLDIKIREKLISNGIKVYYAYHPSDFSKEGGNVPETYFSKRTFEIL